MGEVRYYYSKTGSDVNGPVTKLTLTQLLQTRGVDAASFFCCEGETQWQRLDSGVFKIKEPPLPSRVVVSTPRSKRRRIPWHADERLVDPHMQRRLLLICWIGAFVGAAIGVHLRYVAFPDIQTSPDSALEVLGYFLGVAMGIALIPSLISLVFPYPRSRLARAIGIPCFALFLVYVRYDTLVHDAAVAKRANNDVVEISH